MSDELVGRLARALCKSHYPFWDENGRRPDLKKFEVIVEEDFHGDVNTILSEISAAGYAVVPVEPTEAMLATCWDHQFSDGEFAHGVNPEQARENWLTMLSALRKGWEWLAFARGVWHQPPACV